MISVVYTKHLAQYLAGARAHEVIAIFIFTGLCLNWKLENLVTHGHAIFIRKGPIHMFSNYSVSVHSAQNTTLALREIKKRNVRHAPGLREVITWLERQYIKTWNG